MSRMYVKNINEGAILFIYNFKDLAIEDLYENANLDDSQKQTFANINNIKRQREWLAVRVILSGVESSCPLKIGYKDNGSPYLFNSDKYISISHTGNLAAVLISDKPCGIDMELKERDLNKVKSKFIGLSESKITASSNEIFLPLVWCAKEAIFKYVNTEGVDFIKDIIIESVHFDTHTIIANFRNRELNLHFLEYESAIVVFLV